MSIRQTERRMSALENRLGMDAMAMLSDQMLDGRITLLAEATGYGPAWSLASADPGGDMLRNLIATVRADVHL